MAALQSLHIFPDSRKFTKELKGSPQACEVAKLREIPPDRHSRMVSPKLRPGRDWRMVSLEFPPDRDSRMVSREIPPDRNSRMVSHKLRPGQDCCWYHANFHLTAIHGWVSRELLPNRASADIKVSETMSVMRKCLSYMRLWSAIVCQ